MNISQIIQNNKNPLNNRFTHKSNLKSTIIGVQNQNIKSNKNSKYNNKSKSDFTNRYSYNN